jgi:peptidoglycan/xylan/chitin deacetylase (PgdA/CDA1 family)
VVRSFCIVLLTGLLAGHAWSAAPDRVQVLCYHTFTGQNKIEDFGLREFGSQLDSLLTYGYRFVTFQECIADTLRGKHNLLLTIDDGHGSVRAAYDSVMQPRGIRPVLFVYPGITGTRHFALTWDDLAYLRDQGCTIGSHGYFHEFVDEKHFLLDSAKVLREINESKKILEEKLKISVQIFSYPFGVYSPLTIELARRAGYHYAFTIIGKPLDLPLASRPDLYELPRYFINQQSWKWIYPALKKQATGQKAAPQ